MSMRMLTRESDTIDVFWDSIVNSSEDAKRKFLKEAAKKTKEAVIRYIPRSVKHKKDRVRLADDVQAIVTRGDVLGGQQARIRGGKKTGPLWHLVNDGTWRSNATNFMDKAMAEMDGVMEKMLDEAMKDV